MGSGVRDCYILHGLRSQRLLHPSWALESGSHIGGEVSSSVFATLGLSSAEGELLLCSTAGHVSLLLCLPLSSSLWGSHQVKKSCHFAPPHSVSVSIFIYLQLHPPASTLLHPTVCLSSSLYVSIFIYLHLHPPTLLFIHLHFWLHNYVVIFLHLCPSLW